MEKNCQDLPKNSGLARFFESWLRLLGLEGGVETKYRFIDHRDKLFETVEMFVTVETYFLPVSRSSKTLDRDTIKTNRDRHGYFQFLSQFWSPRLVIVWDILCLLISHSCSVFFQKYCQTQFNQKSKLPCLFWPTMFQNLKLLSNTQRMFYFWFGCL